MIKRRSVPEDKTETLGPSIDVTIEMHEPKRACAPGQRTQKGERDRVVAAEGDEVTERCRLFLDLGERALDVTVRDTEIADIGKIQPLHLGPGRRVIAIDQHSARLADRRRPKPRARPVRGAEIERDAGDANRRVGIEAFDAEKGWTRGKSRNGSHGLYLGEATTGRKGLVPTLGGSAPVQVMPPRTGYPPLVGCRRAA